MTIRREFEGSSLILQVDGILKINEEAEAAYDPLVEDGTVYLAADAFKQRRKMAKRMQKITSFEEDEMADERAAQLESDLHVGTYEQWMSEAQYNVFRAVSEERRSKLFRDAYGSRLAATGRTMSETGEATLEAYIEWFHRSLTIEATQLIFEIAPGQLRKMKNNMPGYVQEFYQTRPPVVGFNLARLAVQDNVMMYDFAAHAGSNRRYVQPAEVIPLFTS